MDISSVLKRNETYIPSWNGNRDLPTGEQIKVSFHWPTFEEVGSLPTLSGFTALAAMVLGRMKSIGQWHSVSLSGMIKLLVEEAPWAKGLSLTEGEAESTVQEDKSLKLILPEGTLDEQVIRKELYAFGKAYCSTLVDKVEGLEQLVIKTGTDLVKAPADLIQLVLEISFHIWNGQSLEKKTNLPSPSVSSSRGSTRKRSSSTGRSRTKGS